MSLFANAAEPDSDESSPPPMLRIIEALLFVGGSPLTPARAQEMVRGLMTEQLVQTVATLNRDYRSQGRPYRIQVRDQGYELVLRPRYRNVLHRFPGTTRETRLAPMTLDALALVAYRQPVTQQEIDSLRGGDSVPLLRQLVRLGLVSVQRGQGEARDAIYSTTPRFLKLFGLRSLDDLPRTQDLGKL